MRRSVLLVVPAVLALALAGCTTASPTPVAAGPGDGWKYYGIQGGGTGETPGTSSADPTLGGENTYDAGLPDGVTVEWADTLFDDPDFTVASPDDGDGHWSYTQVSTGCALSFWQTDAGGRGPVGDESARSETVLAEFLGWEQSDLDGYTADVVIPFAGEADGTFDARATAGTDEDGSDWITLARAFDDPDVALALDVTCPEGLNATDQLGTLTADGEVAAQAQ